MRKKTKFLSKHKRRNTIAPTMESDIQQDQAEQGEHEDEIDSSNEPSSIVIAALKPEERSFDTSDEVVGENGEKTSVDTEQIAEDSEGENDDNTVDDNTVDDNTVDDNQQTVENGDLLEVPQCPNPLQCRYCGKVFTRSFYRKEHERIHTGEKPFSCCVCGKRFNSQGSCRKHERTHSRNKNRTHECEHCGKNFKEMTNLRAHLRTHMGDRPYSCEVCGRSFSLETVLKKHMMFHNGQKQFQCMVCNKSYFTAYDLRIHVRSHTGEKPYKCRYCNQSFASGRRRNLHEKCHDKSETHHCKQCGMIFRSLSCLTMHQVKSQLAGGCSFINSIDHRTSPNNSPSDESHYKVSDGAKSLNQFDENNESEEYDIEFLGRTLHEGNPFATSQSGPYEDRDQIYPTGLVRSTEKGIKKEPLDNDIFGYGTFTNSYFEQGNQIGRNNNNSQLINQSMSIIVTEESGTQTVPLTETDQLFCDMEMAGKIHECKHCKIIFREYSMFLVHKTLHINPFKPLICHLCGIESENNVDFNAHLIWHMK